MRNLEKLLRAGAAFADGFVGGAVRAAEILAEDGSPFLGEPGSVRLHQRRILVNGKPELILSGEIHYFRLAPEEWDSRLDLLQENGLNTVATYIPWLWHELPDGTFDLTGRTHPQRNLLNFIDRCAKRGLMVVARPGPFVMAELKNEGIPYRLYSEDKGLHPVTWNANKVSTRTLDYLAPEFLLAARGWYDAIMPALAERLITKGGPVIAVQLDNEIGMLSWVSNSPDLTNVVCEDMRRWTIERYGVQEATRRIGADAGDAEAWANALRSPTGDTLPLHHDLGMYMRDRFARYVQTLRSLAEWHGVQNVPFLVNIHGTSNGRCSTFPIGISQLYESYRGQPQMTSGSDIYLGDLTVGNGSGLYVTNAFMAAVHDADQPTTSLEFECGTGDYGEDLSQMIPPEATELKTRLCFAQGNRLINYYLHAGGQNPPLETAGDGIDRIAFTGQRHGFAAPVDPEGKPNATYHAITRVLRSVGRVGKMLADSDEEYDDVTLGFVPDHYLTEYRYPGSAARAEQAADMERYRGSGPREILARAMVLNGYSFPAVDLQTAIPTSKALVLATGRTLGRTVQENVAKFVTDGGKLLLVGLLPDRDNDGRPCTVLADALGLKDDGRLVEFADLNKRYWPCVAAVGKLAPRPEVRAGTVQLIHAEAKASAETLLVEVASGKPCAMQVDAGKGQAIFLGCDYPADLNLYRRLFDLLGVSPRWEISADTPSLIVTSTRSASGDRLLHVLNLAPHAVNFSLAHQGHDLFDGSRIMIPARTGFILPIGVSLGDALLKESTAEFAAYGPSRLTVLPTQEEDFLLLETDRDVRCATGVVVRDGMSVKVHLFRSRHGGNPVEITLR